MNIEFTSPAQYRQKNGHFYDAILELLKDPTSKINVNSVTKKIGYSRSSIRKDREQWKPLLEDMEIANQYQLNNPHFVAKSTSEKSKEIKAKAAEYKNKYLNLLSAFYDLSRITEEQQLTIEQLESDHQVALKQITELRNEMHEIKSNGKVIPFNK